MLLSEMLRKAQCGSDEAILMIINKFNPILRKYASLLYRHDDPYEELRYHLILTIKETAWENMQVKSEGAYTNYIVHSLYNAYLSKAKRPHPERNLSSFTDEQEFKILSSLSIDDSYDTLLKEDIKGVLSKREFEIVYWTCLQGMPSAWLAKQLNVSRQYVNQTKKRALKKLSEYWGIDPQKEGVAK